MDRNSSPLSCRGPVAKRRKLSDSDGDGNTSEDTSFSECSYSCSSKEFDQQSQSTSAENKQSKDPLVNSQQTPKQPEGWRVKLYRLNQDGSWDDCGTGRIKCLYENIPSNTEEEPSSESLTTAQELFTSSNDPRTAYIADSSVNSPSLESVHSNGATASGSKSKTNHPNAGYATLCVHAEIPAKDLDAHQPPKILLRTRILLQDSAYQRQGDNIITWCEPFYSPNVQLLVHKDSSIQSSKFYEEYQHLEGGVDLALSFQDNCGCLEIWQQIIAAQGRHVEKVVAAAAAAQLHQAAQEETNHISHHGTSDQYGAAGRGHRVTGINIVNQTSDCDEAASWDPLQQQNFQFNPANKNDSPSNAALEQQHLLQQQQLLNISADRLQMPSPSLQNLDEIADTIAALQQHHHLQQREVLAVYITANDCVFYKKLLEVFPTAESRANYGKLGTLAACVKTILLLNDPTILELTITDASIFELACSCLEYDPDLREKANHRWFLRERAKFRTVVPMNDVELEQSIHRTFRLQYLRDTLLRPTMDESCLSTLSSLQSFIHADVIKGVTMSSYDFSNGASETRGNSNDVNDSYLVRVIRSLGSDLFTLQYMDWMELESAISSSKERNSSDRIPLTDGALSHLLSRSSAFYQEASASPCRTTWKQHLAPQDDSMSSRRVRRRGSLLFLRELFQMVRLSLQQCDKDDFFAVICTLEVKIHGVSRRGKFADDDREMSDTVSQTSQAVEVGSVASTVRSSDRLDEKSVTDDIDNMEALSHQQHQPSPFSITPGSVNILSLLASLLLDPNADISEKGASLEILSGIAMHDASLIRRHCLEGSGVWNGDRSSRANVPIQSPEANEDSQVLFIGLPNDLLSAFVFLLAVETDVGVLLQVSEIMRIILDTDIIGDHGLLSPGFADEADGILPGVGQNPPHDQHNQPLGGSGPTSSEQTHFLTNFYEHYARWLVAPFQFTFVYPLRLIPCGVLRHPSDSVALQFLMKRYQSGVHVNDQWIKTISVCPVRMSFTVELLSFCVRAHLSRMKMFLLKSRAMGIVLLFLRQNMVGVPGERCLKLAILRFLRAILSVNDESYHRHIIQHNLFAAVFDAFRANPVGDNLVSSAVVEMCDYIHTENIKCLLDYIGRKHLTASDPESSSLSLEDVSSPYVSTLTTLRKAYQANVEETQRLLASGQASPGGSRYFPGGIHYSHDNSRTLVGKALEDQRKFQAKDEEESYFETDDDDNDRIKTFATSSSDDFQKREGDLHRTPRMFSLTDAPQLLANQMNVEEIDSIVSTGNGS
jgi:Component of IIS longevity pathway SMK-1